MMLGRSIRVAAVAAALAGACKQEAKAPAADPAAGAPVKADSTDPLWTLAPADVDVALVVADGAGASVQTGLVTVVRALEQSPVTAPLAREIRDSLTVAGIDPLDQAKLAAVGIDLGRGTAFFMSKAGPVAVLPVGDRAKLVAAVGGKSEAGVDRLKTDMVCKDLAGRYACATQAALLDQLGKGGASPVASWPAELRGHIEVYVSAAQLAGSPVAAILSGTEGIRVSARLERGGATVRAHLTGKPAGPLAGAIPQKTRLVADLADQAPSGLFVLQGAALWKTFQSRALEGVPSMQLPGGAALDELARSIDGDIVAYTPSGAPERGFVRIGLSSVEPMKKLLAACDQLAAGAPPGVTIAKKEERCAVGVDRAALGMVGGGEKIGAELWVDEKVGALVAGFGDQAAASTARPPLSALAREILEQPHLFAAWAQGSIAASPSFHGSSDLLAVRGMIAMPILFWLHRLNEIGVAVQVRDDGIHAALRVRTMWDNPEPLVAEADKLFEELAQGKADAARVQALAARYPDAPLAHDVQAGGAGFVLLAAPTGTLAAIAIPSFVGYQQRSKAAEASVELRRLYQSAAEHVVENGSLPAESSPMTPPAGSCCAGPEHRCAPDPALWEGPPWRALKFSMDDPHSYSYQYEVAADGKSFTVRASGDLDCDGTYSSFELKGSIGDDGALSPAQPMAMTNELE